MADFISNEMREKFSSYPSHIRPSLLNLRRIILNVAESEGINDITETLKWGQPSYLSKVSSTIRLDWSEKTPEQYYLYFTCSTKLVETFKEIYPDTFRYHGNRAVIFDIDETLEANNALTHCISMSLNYHKIKHLPLLGN